MTFAESIATCLTKYADFTGRARRSEYWWFFLFNLLVSGVAGWFLPYSIYLVIGLALLIPGLAVAVRRLHDTGKSGWFLLIGLIPLVGAIVLIVVLATEGEPGPNPYGAPAL